MKKSLILTLIISFTFLVSSVFLLTNPKNKLTTKTSAIRQDNKSSIMNYQKSDTKGKIQIGNLLKERQQSLIELAKKNPQKLKEEMFDKETVMEMKTVLPDDLSVFVEEYINTDGKLREVIVDGLDHTDTEYVVNIDDRDYYLATSSKQVLPMGSSNTLVHVNGIKLDNYIITPDIEDLKLNNNPTSQSQSALTNDTLYIISVSFRDNPEEFFPITEIDKKLFDQTKSVKEFFRLDSYGKFNIDGKAYGNYVLDLPSTNCDYLRWSDLADQQLKSDLHLSSVSHLRRFYVTSNRNCPWAGLAYMDGNRAWDAGYNEVSLYTHELGHNYGRVHANSLGCNDKQIDIYFKCKEIEYGNIFDTMGHSWYGDYHSISYNKYLYGWLTNDQIRNVDKTGIYEISPLEIPEGNLPKAIKIPIDHDGNYYYIEYRTQKDFPRNDPVRPLTTEPNIDKGLFINLIYEYARIQPKLLDSTPNSYDDSPGHTRLFDDDFIDSSLVRNDYFYDQNSGIGVILIDKSPDKARILVTFANDQPQAGYTYPDSVFPNKANVSVNMNQQTNMLNFSWTASPDRSCPLYCDPPSGYCTNDALKADVNKLNITSCDPNIGPFSWDLTIKGKSQPKYYLYSNTDKNVSLTPQDTSFSFPCSEVTSPNIAMREVFIRIWTTDALGNKNPYPYVGRGVCY